MIARPTLIVHTTYFSAPRMPEDEDVERTSALELGRELYGLLTRAPADPLAWGPGIPVRIATEPDRIDLAEADHVVVIPVLGQMAFVDPVARARVVEVLGRWFEASARILTVFSHKSWRNVKKQLKTPVLTELYTKEDPRRAVINEILLELARTLLAGDQRPSQLFISHAMVDLDATGRAAEKIHAYVTQETTGQAFFDKVSLLPGEELVSQGEPEPGQGVFVVVRGDLYSSRAWCRQELLVAKQKRMPIVTVEVLSSGEYRSATYSGNGVTVTWSRTGDNPAAQVMTLAMVERVRHLFFKAEGRRVIEAAGLPSDTECLSRPPEILDLGALRRRSESTIVLLHPDPPLPIFERAVLEESDKRVRTATPTTAFTGVVGSAIRAPLDGWQVALSLSDPLAAIDGGDLDGLTQDHLLDGMTFVARALIGAGAAIAYGGDFRAKGFTIQLAQLVAAYNETGRGRADFLHGYLAAQLTPSDDLAYTSHWLRSDPRALLKLSPGDAKLAHRRALYFSDMRRVMADATQARVILGGTAEPSSYDARGYGGRYPGVVEEAWRTLKVGKPLYVAGGFGGAAALVVAALESDGAIVQLTDATWAGKSAWDELAEAWRGDPDVARLELPDSMDALARAIYQLGHAHLESDAASVAWNGLSVDENRLLFRTRDPLTLTALVLKGLVAMSTQSARGQLRVELVEGDVTRATDLDLLVFPTFSDLAPNGVGRELDRVTGGAATLAHKSRNLVPAKSAAFGASFVFAADLGQTTTALRDVERTTERAAESVAALIRRHGFKRVGLVTFLGNVASDVEIAISGMVAGLARAADTAEFAWYESDPERAKRIAEILKGHTDISFTYRTEPIARVAAAVSGEKKRTVVAVRQEAGVLDAALLLHQANGLAPVLRTPFDDRARAQLAGNGSASAPVARELSKRGLKITELLFGSQASKVLENVGDTELVLMHDAAAGGIPFEAMSWDVGGTRFAPAIGGGIVRHLLVAGLRAERALTRTRRARRVGVLVIINPLSDLDGAEAEGDALLAALAGGPFDLRVLRGGDATLEAVLAACGDPDIDVLHYCGHAFFNGPGENESGLDLADAPLTLSHLGGLQSVPRLAFVNACQAGRVRGNAPPVREPQAFAEFFLRAGVDAYLGTFWLVSDAGAAQFASRVYAALVEGRELREAVIGGRRALYEASNSDWANYLLYGHGGFRLVESQPSSGKDEASLAASYRLSGNTVIATWQFPPSVAPTVFATAVVDRESEEPVELAQPQSVQRSEAWLGSSRTIHWTVTLELKPSSSRDLELRPSAGEPVIIPRTPAVAGLAATRSAAVVQTPLAALRTLLEQQPDGGLEVLKAFQPSADPVELRAQIDAKLDSNRALWPLQSLFRPQVDAAALSAFVAAYGLAPIPIEQALDQTFQTKEDFYAYATAPGAIAFTLGKAVLPPAWHELKSPASELTHDLRPDEFGEERIQLALFADNGNGQYASRAIAKQIVDAQLPYAFHLGDVYYGGEKREFSEYFEQPLRPMLDRTELFMLSGNHEMFAKGEWFQEFVSRKSSEFPDRQRQCGEMFRVRGPGFQILGIDTMFSGWTPKQLRLHDHADKRVLEVLETWLAERPDDLSILMTTNQPWDLGSKHHTRLYQSLVRTIAGRVDLWFWGNVHYAALFEPWRFDDAGSPSRSMIGSCIGHGGYPFYTQTQIGDLPESVACRWLEKKARFWPDPRVRPDLGANGWCRLELARLKNRWQVELTFVDWAGRDRLRAKLSRDDGTTIRLDETLESNLTAVGAEPTWESVG